MAVSQDDENSGGRKKSTRLNMWMDTSHYEELNMLAEFEGRTVSDIIRQLVNIHLRDNSESIQNHQERRSQRKRRIER